MEEKNELFDLNNLLLGDADDLDEGDNFNPFADLTQEEESEEDTKEEIEETKIADEEDPQEDVGNEEEQESTESKKNDGASPQNIYSSIAKVLKEEGTFPDLKDEDLNGIEDSESFIEAIQAQIRNSINEEYQRIEAALNVGVQPNVINTYRNSIRYLDGITNDMITNEDNENLRRTLILQDLVNRGYSKERAERAYKKSLDRGDDVDDALDALASNKEFFKREYTKLLNEAQEKEDEIVRNRTEKVQAFKRTIMEDKNLYGDFEVDSKMRQKIYDSLTKPVYTDKYTGETYTAIQKWELDDPTSFNKVLGLMYQLTNGGKDFKNLIKREVKKSVSKVRDEFENAIRNSSSRMEGGKIRLANAHTTDSESFLKGYSLDL